MSKLYLSANGGAQRLFEDLGLTNFKLTLRSQAADVCTFSYMAETVDGSVASCRFAAGESLYIYQDNVCVFIGRFDKPKFSAGGEKWRWNLKAQGPWRRFERTVLMQYRRVKTATDSWTSVKKARILFGGAQDETGDISSVSTKTMIDNWLAYAAECLPDVFSIGRVLPSGEIFPPTWEESDITVAKAIISTLKWHPSAVTWFDYSSGSPVFNVDLAANLETIPVMFTAPELASSDMQDRSDLIPTGIHILYERVSSVTGFEYIYDDAVGTDVGAEGVLVYSVDWTARTDEPPYLVAEKMWAERGTAQYEGSIVLELDSVGMMDGRRWLGSWVRVSGAPVEGPGIVYSVEHDLDLGTCTINIGPAPYLSAADFVSLLAPKSSSSTTSGISGSDYATAGGGSSGSEDNETSILDGYRQEETAKVYDDGVKIVYMLVKDVE